MKIYKIWNKYQFGFNGNNEIFVKVIKETKDKIVGYVVSNWMGNNCGFNERTDAPIISNRKVTINKSNVQGFEELK